LAAFAAVDLSSPFDPGNDGPELGDIGTPVHIDAARALEVLAWLHLGAQAIDRVLPDALEPSMAQLWPEHFDVGIDVASAHGRVNLGASPGDADCPNPYLYVAPWEESRPGDATFWNAPFGAVLERGTMLADWVTRAVTFFRLGLGVLG
jgi:hypothetical protein